MVADVGVEDIGEEEGVEDALVAGDHEAHEPAKLGHLEEDEEVHTFVVVFFEKGFHPRA